MADSARTTTGIAYDRAGPRGDVPVVLVHAGVADRRMWDPIWPGLAGRRDAVRLDLRGFGASTGRPAGPLRHYADLLATVDELGIGRCHLVGDSLGAGVVVEAALDRPGLAASLLLAAPGGALLTTMTPRLREIFDAERAALDRGDIDAAVEANLSAWVDGTGRTAADADPALRASVGRMQRRAFEVTAGWDDVAEAELDPPAPGRLHELTAPTVVLLGGHDVDAVADAARHLCEDVGGARRVDWPDTAHLPPMERPGDFLTVLNELLDSAER